MIHRNDIREKMRENPFLPIHNLTELLLSKLDDDEKIYSQNEPDNVGTMLMKHLKWAFIGSNNDNCLLAVFDPLKGIWDTSEITFKRLIQRLKPAASNHQMSMVLEMIKAYTDGKVLHPYEGSNYLLFKNGFLDINKNEFHSNLSSAEPLNFINKNRLNVRYATDPKLPEISNASKKWTPKVFLDNYTNGNKEMKRMFLFTLSLGLFGNHNFGVNVSYKGQSGSGKTTLSNIFENIYSGHIANVKPKALSTQFGLGNYDQNLPLIWVSENNGHNNDYDFITSFDKLTDNKYHINIKYEKDAVLGVPPQLYVEGTQLVHELDDSPLGVYRRTLCYVFPEKTKKEINYMQVPYIEDYLEREDVLQWLIDQMIGAYKECVPSELINSYRFNADDKNLVKLFPDEYTEWRKDIIDNNSGFNDDIDNFIQSYILPYINKDPFGNLTIMQTSLVYSMFKSYYAQMHVIGDSKIDELNYDLDDDKFFKKFKSKMIYYGFNCVYLKGNNPNKKYRKLVANPHNINFDIDEYIHDNGDPNRSFDASSSPFSRKVIGWFEIVPIEHGGNNNG